MNRATLIALSLTLAGAALAQQPQVQPPAGGKTALPGQIQINPGALTPVFTNWDFSKGLTGWTRTGNAFDSQPTVGDNVTAGRIPGVGALGGDYWQLPFPVGNRDKNWLGTYENHPVATAPLGAVQGDAPMGTLTSPGFTIGTELITFLIGGGEHMASEHVALELNEGGVWREVQRSTGDNSEYMRRQVWTVTPYKGKTARIVIRDMASGAWGHINVADFRFTNENPLTLNPDDADAATPGPLPGRPERRVPLDLRGAIFGVADLHTHPAAQLGFGGKMYEGDPLGLITDFGFCRDGHQKDPSYLHAGLPTAVQSDLEAFGIGLGVGVALLLAPISMPILTNFDPGIARKEVFELGTGGIHSGVGYPAFQNYKSSNMLHHHMHMEWIRRAYDGGLRLMVAHPVHNAFLANLAPRFDGQSLDDKSVGDRQIAYIRDVMIPRNATWMGLARTPGEARQLIRQGKLAVVLGLELDTIGNWGQNSHPTPVQYQAEIQRLYDAGVRHIFPVHFADNAFGGSAISGDLFNMNNFFINGKFHKVVDGRDVGVQLRLNALDIPGVLNNKLAINNGTSLSVPAIRDAFNQVRPMYTATPTHRNSEGLYDVGRQGLERMMSLGMIVDIDHMSQNTRTGVLSLCESRSVNGVTGYPVVCGHTAFRELAYAHGQRTEVDALPTHEHDMAFEADQNRELVTRIVNLGGMVSVITAEKNLKRSPGCPVPADGSGTSKMTAQLLHFASQLSGPTRGIGIGTDMALLGGFGPRFGVRALPALVPEAGMPVIGGGDTPIDQTVIQATRTRRAFAERNGVIYDQPVLDHYRYRYFYSRDYRGYERAAIHTAKQRDFLESLAIQSAGKTGETADQPNETIGRARVTIDTINAFCKGLRETSASQVDGYAPFGAFRDEMRAAFFCRFPGIERENEGVRRVYQEIKPVWDSWQAMRANPQHPTPLRKLVYRGTVNGKPYVRDFDINIDGFAHYGMLPDALQELTDVGLDTQTRIAMFKGAEQYIRTWEKAWSMRR